jgi:hypothetical protein
MVAWFPGFLQQRRNDGLFQLPDFDRCEARDYPILRTRSLIVSLRFMHSAVKSGRRCGMLK